MFSMVIWVHPRCVQCPHDWKMTRLRNPRRRTGLARGLNPMMRWHPAVNEPTTMTSTPSFHRHILKCLKMKTSSRASKSRPKNMIQNHPQRVELTTVFDPNRLTVQSSLVHRPEMKISRINNSNHSNCEPQQEQRNTPTVKRTLDVDATTKNNFISHNKHLVKKLWRNIVSIHQPATSNTHFYAQTNMCKSESTPLAAKYQTTINHLVNHSSIIQ